MDVREAGLGDVADWVGVERAASAHVVITEAFVADSLSALRWLAHAVAVRSGTIVGVARLGGRTELGAASLKIVVHPEHRRQGAGSALLHWASQAARAAGAGRLAGVCEE